MNENSTHLIDEVLERWKQQLNLKTPSEAGCEHEAREYMGFTERYNFCLKCDAKLIDGNWIEKRRH